MVIVNCDRDFVSVKTFGPLVPVVLLLLFFLVAAFAAASRKSLSASRPLVPVPGEAHDDASDNEPDDYQENYQDSIRAVHDHVTLVLCSADFHAIIILDGAVGDLATVTHCF